jgi:hypothetical protein
MRVAILCEFSGVVRDAFISHGHDAVSCDLLPTESPGPHIQADCLTVDWTGYDMIIAHPPCTYLCVSGARWWDTRREQQREAIRFVQSIMMIDVPRMCIENPVGVLSRVIGPATQIVNPYDFGDQYKKRTCLWLRGLPKLIRTSSPENPIAMCHNMSPSPDRSKKRSITYPGMANEMARQWGNVGAAYGS